MTMPLQVRGLAGVKEATLTLQPKDGGAARQVGGHRDTALATPMPVLVKFQPSAAG